MMIMTAITRTYVGCFEGVSAVEWEECFSGVLLNLFISENIKITNNRIYKNYFYPLIE